MQKILLTFQMALRDAKTNFFHTLLSVLGIVIGVAALVGILSLIDGMENYAHRQISQTTSLESIVISPITIDYADNVRIAKQDYAYFTYPEFRKLQQVIGQDAKGYMVYRESGYLNGEDTSKRKGTLFSGIVETWNDNLTLITGRFFNSQDIEDEDSVMVLNKVIAQQLQKEENLEKLLDQRITYKGGTYTIIGVIESLSKEPKVFVPITLISTESIKNKPPTCMLVASSVELVPQMKNDVEAWINYNFEGNEKDFRVSTNEGRVDQVNKGFVMFRIVMGLIVGISVLVGGIGVMNVLLISVNERTTEIGVRKAVGAKPKDIVVQFLSESITISVLGSMLGLIIGVLFTMAAVPIIKHFSKMPFEAAYTLNTLLTISVVAIIIGIVFGTYPAVKA